MEDLEGPDDTITLQRAAQIAGLTLHTLSDAARAGRLAAVRPGHDWLTTRRDLHRYLGARSRGVVKPLPPHYLTPDGEEPIAPAGARRPSVRRRTADNREPEPPQPPIVRAEAGRLAKALRAFSSLGPLLVGADRAALEHASEILERIAEIEPPPQDRCG